MAFRAAAAAALRAVPKTAAYHWQSEEDRMKIVAEMQDANSGAVGKVPLLLSKTAEASLFTGRFSLFAIVELPVTAGVKYPKRVGIIAVSNDGDTWKLDSFNISDTLHEKFLAMDTAAITQLTTRCYADAHYKEVVKKILESPFNEATPHVTIAPQSASISTMPPKQDGSVVRYVCLDNYVRV